MEKFRIYNKKKLFEETHLLNKGRFPRWELRHTYCLQTRRDCVRMGLWEILPSQLSNVQKDHHSPTYWSFSWALLWVIFKTASLFKKKKPKIALNLYIQVVTIHLHQSSELGVKHSKVHGKTLCLSSACAVVWTMWVYWVLGMRVSARTKMLTQTSGYAEYLNIEVKGQSGNSLLWYSWSSSALCEDILHRSFHCIHYVLWFMINWKQLLAVFNTSQELQI